MKVTERDRTLCYAMVCLASCCCGSAELLAVHFAWDHYFLIVCIVWCALSLALRKVHVAFGAGLAMASLPSSMFGETVGKALQHCAVPALAWSWLFVDLGLALLAARLFPGLNRTERLLLILVSTSGLTPLIYASIHGGVV